MKFSIKSVYKFTAMSGLIMIALFTFTSQAFAQKPDYRYTYTFGGAGVAENHGTTIDPSGNVYVTGTFQGTVDFDPTAGTDNKTSSGNYDIFLTKINVDESYAYTYTFVSDAVFADSGTSVATDSIGNVYLVGSYYGNVDFDPTIGVDSKNPGGLNYGTFLTKINADGTYGYTHTFTDASENYSSSVTVDNNDNIYFVGSFAGTADFNPTGVADSKTSAGSHDIFLTKINADGTYGYTLTFGGTQLDRAYGVTTDSNGNVYLTGYFKGTANFPVGGADPKVSAGDIDIFLTKINADGTYGNTRTFGGLGEDAGNAVTTDNNDNVYLTGYFSGTADFNATGGSDNKISTGDFDVFLTKIDAAGAYVSTSTFGGAGSDSYGDPFKDYGNALTTDTAGNLYLAGNFGGTVDFDPTVGVDNQTAGGWHDAYLTKINADGTYDYTYIFGGSDLVFDDTWSEGGVAVDSNGIYIAGRFYGSADFDPTAGVDVRTDNNGAFLVKLVFPSTPPPPPPPVPHGGGVIFPLIKVLKVPTPLDLPAGPDLVTYNYAVSNIAIIAMSNITVTDDKCSSVVFISGDTNNDSYLDTNEIWNYRCSMTLSQTTTNTVTATGQAFSATATDTANATVVVSLPPPPIIIPPVVPPIIGQVLGVSTSIVPSFPKTGFPPREAGGDIPWNIVIFSIFVVGPIALTVILRKRAISPLNKD